MAGEEDKAKGEAEKAAAMVQAKMEAMEKELDGVKKAKEGLELKMKSQDEELLTDGYLEWLEEKEQKGKKGVVKEEDLDSLTPSQLLQHASQSSKEALQEALDGFDKKVQKLSDNLTNMGAFFDLSLAKIRSPELSAILESKEGKDRFLSAAKENPKWDANRIWKQMRADDMLAAKDKEAEELQKKEEELKVIAHAEEITPNAASKKTISRDEAGELAYRKAIGNGGS